MLGGSRECSYNRPRGKEFCFTPFSLQLNKNKGMLEWWRVRIKNDSLFWISIVLVELFSSY